ncbi:MAG: 2-C-methyl-D-erythritol 2,4-cyclodiphosphate synthase [Planctomycetota bacterium]|jgi:2-C-methyl-D-erythritol 2,4-cyclodiphosphate synthase|nr:2-C-methyl-D-erythritol 2,4-cyclodiphosphate synthase [Planctomycetota bacterium]
MSIRIGFGTDCHRLEPGGNGFPLCGVLLDCPLAVVAVSDGDAAIHALVDALLGAAGLGDIGDHYPENKVVSGGSSERFLRETAARITALGGEIVNIDLVVDLQQPKLGPRKREMADNIARILEMPDARVNVKAKTGEGVGPIGLGQAVAAQAAVLVEFPE